MSGKDRIAIFPSRANHVLMKARIVSANKGLSLLKRKRDALDLKLREIMGLRTTVAQDFDRLFSEAIFSIAKANFLETDFKPALIIGSERADACMRLTYAKTIGVLLPTFEPMIRKPESLPLTGLSRGGKQVDVIRDRFQELLRTIILLASYDYSIRTLEDSIRSTNMRLNGLEFVVIPRFNNTSAYISDELDELDREEFYRLKRSQGKQRALREKGKEKSKPKENVPGYADANTWTGDDQPKQEEEELVLLPLAIFMKKKFTSAAQTLISGHFPGSYEMISPTDSILSGEVPTVSKRSSFKTLNVIDVKVSPSGKFMAATAATPTPMHGPETALETAHTSTQVSERSLETLATTATVATQKVTSDLKSQPTPMQGSETKVETAHTSTPRSDLSLETSPTTATVATQKVTSELKPQPTPETSPKQETSEPLLTEASDEQRPSPSQTKQSRHVSLADEDIKRDITSQVLSTQSMLKENNENISKTTSGARSKPLTDTETSATSSTRPPSTTSTTNDETSPEISSTAVSSDKISSLDIGSNVPESSVDTASEVIDIDKFNEPSLPSTSMRAVVSLHDSGVQTDITGRYPRRSEMNSPSLNWNADPYTARSQTNMRGRHGRASNTEHGNTSESEEEEEPVRKRFL